MQHDVKSTPFKNVSFELGINKPVQSSPTCRWGFVNSRGELKASGEMGASQYKDEYYSLPYIVNQHAYHNK